MKPEETAEETPSESASKTSGNSSFRLTATSLLEIWNFFSVTQDETGSQAADEAGSQVSDQPVDEKPKKKEKLIKNQFNYQDRGTQSGQSSINGIQ